MIQYDLKVASYIYRCVIMTMMMMMMMMMVVVVVVVCVCVGVCGCVCACVCMCVLVCVLEFVWSVCLCVYMCGVCLFKYVPVHTAWRNRTHGSPYSVLIPNQCGNML